MAKLIYQFPARESVQQDELLQWIGFREDSNQYLIGGEVTILAVLSIQRIALRWKHNYEKKLMLKVRGGILGFTCLHSCRG